jgi:prepilin-type N-terminal cleavage/methylation domain-containing protein
MQKYGVERIMHSAKNAGFTLIEVMVAMVVLAIGFLGASSMMTGTTGSNASAFAITGAATAAADQLEVLTALSYNDPLLVDTSALGTADMRNPLPSIAEVQTGTRDVPDDVARPADFQITTSDNLYTIYWNVVDNFPVNETKTIVVIGVSTGLGPQKAVVLQHILPERT